MPLKATSVQGVITALKAANEEQARTAAATASSGLKKLADFVDPAQPEAAKAFRAAATALDGAAAKFPDGLSVAQQVQTDINNASTHARQRMRGPSRGPSSTSGSIDRQANASTR